MKKFIWAFLSLVLVLLITSCGEKYDVKLYEETGIKVFIGVQPPYAKHYIYSVSGGKAKTSAAKIKLRENANAVNPTWSELLIFLEEDRTETFDYNQFSYACGAFAETLHNNAEDSGIRAAWVALDFSDSSVGHALNAFDTTDRGLVYVDDTGVKSTTSPRLYYLGGGTSPIIVGKDKVAYLQIGKSYGELTISSDLSLDYSEYTDAVVASESYNSGVYRLNRQIEEYNSYIKGKTFTTGTSDHIYVTNWHNQLDAERDRLDQVEQSLKEVWLNSGSIVSEIEIYW